MKASSSLVMIKGIFKKKKLSDADLGLVQHPGWSAL